MRRGALVGGFHVITEPSNANAGMSQWAIAERDGNRYFIKRYLAPKFPTAESPGTPSGHARRRRECEAFESRQLTIMDRLRNDVPGAGHLVTPLSFFRVGPSYYKVTDLVAVDDGLSLADCQPGDVAVAIRSLLASLRVVHAAGVVHSDLKPDNILFERTSAGVLTCKLIDFDESYLSGEPPEFVRLVGDPFFYSPEMLAYVKQLDAVGATSLTTASDVFAVGILIHVLLTGTAPGIDSELYAYPCEAVRNSRFPQLHPALGSGPLAVALGKTMALNPLMRPSIDDLLKELTRSRLEQAVMELRNHRSSDEAQTGSEQVSEPDHPRTTTSRQDEPGSDIRTSDASPMPRLRFNLGRQSSTRTPKELP